MITLPSVSTSFHPVRLTSAYLKQALEYRIWNLGPSSKKLHKGKIWDFGTKLGLFLGPFLYLSGTFSRYFHKNAAKLTKGKKGFKNRVVATFYAKLRPFGDHFWTFICTKFTSK